MTGTVYIAYSTDEFGPGHRIFTQRLLAEAWLIEHPHKDSRIVERQTLSAAVAHLAQREQQANETSA